MKKLLLSLFLLLNLGTLNLMAETAYYVFVMFYGNDSEPLLTTIQVDDTLKARLEKRNIKFEWSEGLIPRDFLILEGNRVTAECDLSEFNETWCVTDANQRIIGISEIFPVGREISWFRISEYNSDFAIEAPGKDISVEFYKSIVDERADDNIELNKGKRFIFNFENKEAKIGSEGVQFIVKRK